MSPWTQKRDPCCVECAETCPQPRWQLLMEQKMSRESRGLWSLWCGGQGQGGSRATVLLLCHDCPPHRGHWAPASLTLTQLGLPCASGSALTGWTCLADPLCTAVPHHHGSERHRQGLCTRLCRPQTQCWPSPCSTEPPGRRIRPLLLTDFAGPSIPRGAKQPCGSSSGTAAVWLGPPVAAACPARSPLSLSGLGMRGWHVHTASPGRAKRAAGAARAACRRQPIMLY